MKVQKIETNVPNPHPHPHPRPRHKREIQEYLSTKYPGIYNGPVAVACCIAPAVTADKGRLGATRWVSPSNRL